MKRLLFCLALIATGAGSALAQAPVPQAPVQFDELKRADGARLVPERFLQPWDPITLFFDAHGKYVAVGDKRVDGVPDLRKPASVGGNGVQFTVPDCPTCKEKAKKLSKK